jgi:AcrR family transcriptional regulator
MSYHYPHHIGKIRALPPDRERVSELLAHYPRVSDDEVREILNFMRTGRHLEIGLLTSSERLRPQLDAFMKDHQRHFRVKWGEGVVVSAGLIGLLAILWLVWEAFA